MISRLRAILIIACVVVAGLTGGEAGNDDVRSFELPDAFLRLRLHDAARLVERFNGGAYGRLLNSPTGQLLKGQLELTLKNAGQEMATVLAIIDQIQAAGASFSVNEENFNYDPTVQVAMKTTGIDDLFGLLGRFGPLPPPVEGNETVRMVDRRTALCRFGDILALRHHREAPTGIVQNLEPAADIDAAADLEAAFVLKPIAEGHAKWMQDQEQQRSWAWFESALFKIFEGLEMTGTAILTDAGVRERFTCKMQGTLAEIRDVGAAKPKVAKDLFAALPGETLCAVAWSEGIEVVAAVFREMGLAEQAQRSRRFINEEWFLGTGILEAIDGPGIAYLEMVDGQLVITIQQSMAPNTGALMGQMMVMAGNEILREMARELPLSARPLLLGKVVDGEDIKTVTAGYIDGCVIVTSHPKGLAGVTGRAGGFSMLPGVKTGIDALPQEAMILGLSNSPESWATVGGLIAKATTEGLEMPLFNTLADDFRAAARRGWLWADVSADGSEFVIESEGLLGWSTGVGGMIGWFTL